MSASSNKADRLSGEEVVDLVHLVSGLTQAGLPLGPGLKALGEEIPSPRLARAFRDLGTQIEQGKPLDEILGDSNHSSRFPSHLRGLVAAGLRTGRLGTILDQFVRFEQTGSELRRNFWLSLTYPLILLVGMVFLFAFVGTVIVRDMSSIYNDFGIDLPRATISVIQTGELMARHQESIYLLAAVLSATLIFLLTSKFFFGERLSRWFASRIPIIGWVAVWTSLAEFFHLLGLLIESDVPLDEALKLAGGGIRDSDIRITADRLAYEIEQGQTLSQAIGSVRWLPSGLPVLLNWAEGNQSLGETLHLIAGMFESRARAYSNSSASLISIIIVTSVVITIGVVAASLFIPMISLISKLSG